MAPPESNMFFPLSAAEPLILCELAANGCLREDGRLTSCSSYNRSSGLLKHVAPLRPTCLLPCQGSFINLQDLKSCSPDRSSFLLPDDSLTLPDEVAEPTFLSSPSDIYGGLTLRPALADNDATDAAGCRDYDCSYELALLAPDSPSADSCTAEFQKALFCLTSGDIDSGIPTHTTSADEEDDLACILRIGGSSAPLPVSHQLPCGSSHSQLVAAPWSAGDASASLTATMPLPAALRSSYATAAVPAVQPAAMLATAVPSAVLHCHYANSTSSCGLNDSCHASTTAPTTARSATPSQQGSEPLATPLLRAASAAAEDCTAAAGMLSESGSHNSDDLVPVAACGSLASGSFVSAAAAVSEGAVTAPVLPKTFHHKSGGPCDHCHATESPQWRRGPASKPVLCNACGTRFRRTNSLGPPCSIAASKAGRGAPAAPVTMAAPRKKAGSKRSLPGGRSVTKAGRTSTTVSPSFAAPAQQQQRLGC